MIDKANIEELKKYSEKIGSNIDWIQGAGGNTSVKDEETLWVKASGCWLANAISDDIFIPLKISEVNKAIANNSLNEITSSSSKLRPSIETSLHALMPHKYVFHTHSVSIISVAVLLNGKDYLENLFKDLNWAWVPYEIPGINLAHKIQEVLSEKPDVIVLANHGIVVGAEMAKDAYKILCDVEIMIGRGLRTVATEDLTKLEFLIDNTNYRICKYPIVNSLANDKLSLKIMQTGTLYPDHIVFLGPGPMKIIEIEKIASLLVNEGSNEKNKVIVIEGMGVIVDENISKNAEDMLYCLAGVLLRINSNEKICYLNQKNEDDLLGLNSEKFRKLIQK